MKKAIIIGATSGIGQEVAKCLLLDGWQIGVAGRRQSALENLQRAAPDQIQIQTLDVTQEDAGEKLNMLIDKVGGMDLFLLSSGIGFQNTNLNMEVELNTAYTNVEGFIRMVDTAFIYFRKSGGGHLAVISSIAGTKGLGVAPAYSATKRFQNTYIDALEQLSYLQKLKHYPLLMDAAKVGRHIAWSLERKQRIVVIDWRYRILVFFWKMIPRWMWKRLPVKTN